MKEMIAVPVMMVCVRVVGLCVPYSCCGSPWPPHRLLVHSARSFALALVDAQFQTVPPLPRPNKYIVPRSFAVLV